VEGPIPLARDLGYDLKMMFSKEAKPVPAGVEPNPTQAEAPQATRGLRKFSIAVPPGRAEYRISHNLQTADVIVQTRIAGRIREGGVSVIDANTVQLTFGGTLNETLDVVIIG
jgi:hypothetical protein